MTRQEKFEAYFAESRGLEPGSLAQYRFSTIEGYRLPDLARSYRDFCAGMDAVVVELPPLPEVPEDPEEAIDDRHMDAYHSAIRMRHACAKLIEAAGLKVVP